ncbi:Uncharacterised protein [uncultured archaeon]|nr:Uncharacterised protein [uncultured archaeon]
MLGRGWVPVKLWAKGVLLLGWLREALQGEADDFVY